jgi:hypothetical protein
MMLPAMLKEAFTLQTRAKVFLLAVLSFGTPQMEQQNIIKKPGIEGDAADRYQPRSFTKECP